MEAGLLRTERARDNLLSEWPNGKRAVIYLNAAALDIIGFQQMDYHLCDEIIILFCGREL